MFKNCSIGVPNQLPSQISSGIFFLTYQGSRTGAQMVSTQTISVIREQSKTYARAEDLEGWIAYSLQVSKTIKMNLMPFKITLQDILCTFLGSNMHGGSNILCDFQRGGLRFLQSKIWILRPSICFYSSLWYISITFTWIYKYHIHINI